MAIDALSLVALQPPQFPLANPGLAASLSRVQVTDIKEFAERRPFRPFMVRLNNGASYVFKDPRNLGAPRDYHVIFFFGDTEFALIDADSIAEIMPQ